MAKKGPSFGYFGCLKKGLCCMNNQRSKGNVISNMQRGEKTQRAAFWSFPLKKLLVPTFITDLPNLIFPESIPLLKCPILISPIPILFSTYLFQRYSHLPPPLHFISLFSFPLFLFLFRRLLVLLGQAIDSPFKHRFFQVFATLLTRSLPLFFFDHSLPQGVVAPITPPPCSELVDILDCVDSGSVDASSLD